MSIANLLIEKLLSGEGDLQAVLPLRLIFAADDARALNSIEKHYRKHGKTPSLALFRLSHPEEEYKINPDGYKVTFDELIEQGRQQVERAELSAIIGQAIDLHDQDKISEAKQAVLDWANKPALDQPKDRLQVLSLEDLESLDDPEPLIEGVLDMGAVAMLNGYRGSGKSFIALDWACSVATGTEWFGHKTYHGPVLYIAAEGGHGMKKRIKAWQADHKKIEPGFFNIVIKPVQLTDAKDVAWLKKQVAEEDYALVVIDTQARCSRGLEENSAKDMGILVDHLFAVRDGSGEGFTTILDVHHTGYQSGRARGSTALEGAMDAVFTVECPGGEHPKPHERMTLKNTKQKDRAEHPNMTFALSPAMDSCVVVEVEAIDETEGLQRIQVLELLTKAEDGITSPDVQKLGIKQTTANYILNKLVEDGTAAQDGVRGRAKLYRLASKQ